MSLYTGLGTVVNMNLKVGTAVKSSEVPLVPVYARKCCTFMATVAASPSVAREVRACTGNAFSITTVVLSETV